MIPAVERYRSSGDGGIGETGRVEITARDILRLRLLGQRIEPAGTRDVAATVRRLLAVQAQDFSQALWAIGLRADGSRRTDVLAALERGEVVRTAPMRGTLHFVAAEDLRWLLSVTAERSLRAVSTRLRALGLDRDTLDRAALITREALAGGGRLSRDEYLKLLAARGIAPDGQRGYHIIYYLSQLGMVCWGPPAATQQALVLVDEWIASAALPERADAVDAFALRYFAGHGPATERDLAWWGKLTLADVRAAIARLGDRLTPLVHEQTTYWMATSEWEAAASHLGSVPRGPSTVHALPGFDEYLLGYQDRSLILPVDHAQRIVPGNNGMFLPMIVSRGRIVGTWRRPGGPGNAGPGVQPDHFRPASSVERRGVERAATRYSEFLSV